VSAKMLKGFENQLSAKQDLIVKADDFANVELL
jgi:hypothetical protein